MVTLYRFDILGLESAEYEESAKQYRITRKQKTWMPWTVNKAEMARRFISLSAVGAIRLRCDKLRRDTEAAKANLLRCESMEAAANDLLRKHEAAMDGEGDR